MLRFLQPEHVHGTRCMDQESTYLILLLVQESLVGVDELQVRSRGDVHMAPLLGQEMFAQGLYTLMEQHTKLWHLCAHLQHSI